MSYKYAYDNPYIKQLEQLPNTVAYNGYDLMATIEALTLKVIMFDRGWTAIQNTKHDLANRS